MANYKFIKIFGIAILTAGLLFFSSCKSDSNDGNSADEEKKILEQYISDNGITVNPTASGLYYIEKIVGTGKRAENGNSCTVQYTGKFLNGNVFDSGVYTFVLGSGKVIKGWDEGIAKMNVGGSATLILPSSLAYGSSGAGSIPPYTSLVFEVQLLSAL